MDDIKLFAKNEKELATLIQVVRIYSQDTGMKYSIEKCALLIIKSGKWHMTEVIELRNEKRSEYSEKKKLANVWVYWKRTPTEMKEKN